MNEKFIRELAKQDRKTLSQKALKVCEEAGELAKVILPYDNASGTIHRFVDRKAILEEIADVYLTIISIAYAEDFSDEEIQDMVEYKAKKWADIQRVEAKLQDKIPYEIHVTVSGEISKDKFIRVCNGLGVKPIILDLQKDENIIKDVMTSSVYMGNNRGAYQEMKRISNGLWAQGFEIAREKIETVPWHSAAPSSKGRTILMPKDCYFETHIGVVVPNQFGTQKSILARVAKDYGAHLSRNAFKTHADGSFTQMVTYRKYEGTYEEFEAEAQRLETAIRERFAIEKRITEFSIFDTKVSHDSAWLTG